MHMHVLAGNDSGGRCGPAWCPHVTSADEVAQMSMGGITGDACWASWRPEDFGVYLGRLTALQQTYGRMEYNEVCASV